MGDMWTEVRRDFPALERHVYLNAAAGSPTPRRVREALDAFHRDFEEGGDGNWSAWIERRERIRDRVARFIGAEPDEITFVQNTSAGINLAVDLLAEDGDVLSDDLEFPTVTLPWVHRGVRVHFVAPVNGVPRPADFDSTVAPPAATIAVSQVQFSNGCRLDLAALGALKHNRHLVVSGSQGLGAFPLDVKACRIDALACAGHKWMCAGYGAGFAYLSRPLLARAPRAIGWLSVQHPFRFDNRTYTLLPGAIRHELGCPAFPGIFALGAAVEYLDGLGAQAISERVLQLNTQLTERLRAAGFSLLSPQGAQRSGQTLVAVDTPVRAQAFLNERGVKVTRKLEGLRLSTHFYNDESDVDACVDALCAYRRTTAD